MTFARQTQLAEVAVRRGFDIKRTNELPVLPSDGERARRIVRHGMADVLAWLNQEVGPAPHEALHCVASGNTLLVSKQMEDALRDRLGPKYPDVEVQLSGEDCNAFAIMGRVTQALRKAGVSSQEQDEFRLEAMSGNYDHLLRTAMRWVSVS